MTALALRAHLICISGKHYGENGTPNMVGELKQPSEVTPLLTQLYFQLVKQTILLEGNVLSTKKSYWRA